jgi:hypothetical protein
MSESRDSNDPRDLMRGMRKEARSEFDATEASDTGGQEHATRDDREGVAAGRRTGEKDARRADRASRDQSAAAQRVPRGDAATGGGGNAARSETAPAKGEPHDD